MLRKIHLIVISCMMILNAEKLSDSEWIKRHGVIPANKGWAVIVNGSKDSIEAQSLYNDYKANNTLDYEQIIPSRTTVTSFPLFLKSDEIYGLNTGYWITIALISKDREIAQKVAQYLKESYGSGYIREIRAADIPSVNIENLRDTPLNPETTLLGSWTGKECLGSTYIRSLDSIELGLSSNQVWIQASAERSEMDSSSFDLYYVTPLDLGRGGMSMPWGDFSSTTPIATLTIVNKSKIISKWHGLYNDMTGEYVKDFAFDWCDDTLSKSKD